MRRIHVYGPRQRGQPLQAWNYANLRVLLDDEGNCYKRAQRESFVPTDWDSELRKLETCLTALGWTLTTPYAEDFVAQKRNALLKQGISLLTITVDPQETNIH